MRFLLIYRPPESFFIRTTRVFYGLSPPLGLLYVAKVLQNNGNTVTILDFSAEQFDEQKLRTAIQHTDAVGLSVLSSSITQVKQINQLIQKHKPHLPIIIGGPHCTLLPEKSLIETQANICVQGDSEIIIPDLVKALNKEKKFSDIPGVYIHTNQGTIQGPPSQATKNLDSIPFPSRTLVNHYIYGREYNPRLKAGEFTSIITSRGCPYHCRF